jgi:hypothetical protein
MEEGRDSITRGKEPARRPDVEWIAFCAGAKPALRLTVATAEAAAVERRLTKGGASVTRAERNVQIAGRETAVLYAAPTDEASRTLRDAEADILPDVVGNWTGAHAVAHHRLGILLGYPRCCVDAFVTRLGWDIRQDRDGRWAHEDFVAAEDTLSRSGRLFGRLNHLRFDRNLRLVSFFPCRYDCAAALGVVDGVIGALHTNLPDALPALRIGLAVVVGVWRDGRREVGPRARDADLQLDFSVF